MARLCVDWEKAAHEAETTGVRVVLVRVGVVLDKNGGALAKMLPPFKMFVGGPIGSGKQYVSWIHHDDLVGLILLAIDRANVSGPLNGTAPSQSRTRSFSSALGKALGRPSFLPTPGFVPRAGIGGSGERDYGGATGAAEGVARCGVFVSVCGCGGGAQGDSGVVNAADFICRQFAASSTPKEFTTKPRVANECECM